MNKNNLFMQKTIDTQIDEIVKKICRDVNCQPSETMTKCLKENFKHRLSFSNAVIKTALTFTDATQASNPGMLDRELVNSNKQFNSWFPNIGITSGFYVAVTPDNIDTVILSNITHCGTRAGVLVGYDLEGNLIRPITTFVAVSELTF
jgi:hypothetical protein